MPYGITTEKKKTTPVYAEQPVGDAEESRQSAQAPAEKQAGQSGNGTTAAQQPAEKQDSGVSEAAYDEAIAALVNAQNDNTAAMTDLDSQISDIYDKIVNRKPFEYDINSDALYQQYAEEYTRLGKRAMEDTMGQAAALTGGYGSTYAQNVGQQEYDRYLENLSGMVPEFYDLRRNEYDAQGDELLKQYGMLTDMRTDRRQQQAQNYEQLLTLINIGYKPTDEEIAAAGLTQEQAQSILDLYGDKGSSGGSTGSYDYSGLRGAPEGWDENDIMKFQREHGLADDGIWGPKTEAAYYGNGQHSAGYSDAQQRIQQYLASGYSSEEINSFIQSLVNNGYITAEEARSLFV